MALDSGLRESISFYPRNKVYCGKGHSTHIDAEYELVEDTTTDGIRTIVLKEKDRTELMKKVERLVDIIAERIGEGESKAVKAILFDEFKDYAEEYVDDITKRVTVKSYPANGCCARPAYKNVCRLRALYLSPRPTRLAS